MYLGERNRGEGKGTYRTGGSCAWGAQCLESVSVGVVHLGERNRGEGTSVPGGHSVW